MQRTKVRRSRGEEESGVGTKEEEGRGKVGRRRRDKVEGEEENGGSLIH